jgi:bifunctional non-homologous end joining protein LigD
MKRSIFRTPFMIALPHIKPVLPTLAGKPPLDDSNWIYDLKYDGFRGIYYRSTTMNQIRSKNDKRLALFAGLEKKLSKCIQRQEVILDGEVCSLDPSNRPIFNDLMSWKGNIVYIAFDILWLNGKDLRMLPLSERKDILQGFVKDRMECVKVAISTKGQGSKLLSLARKYDLEGLIAKLADGFYAKRTRWFKVLNPNYTQKRGRHNRFANRRS